MKSWPIVLFIFLTACQVNKKPDLALLYQPHGTDHSNTPLILLHGSLGSKLRLVENQEEVWPGKINDLIFSNYKVLANVIKPESLEIDYAVIESYAIFDSYSGLSIYDDIIETLTTYGGYQLGTLEQQTPINERPMYIFHYDWRQDNVHNAQQLATFIDSVLTKHPKHSNVDVVAHSMGGLILRYYQRFGDFDVLPNLISADRSIPAIKTNSQAHKIRHAIFLGTPQLGSVKPAQRLKAGFDFNLRNIPVEVQITMPSIYQLLPHPESNWLSTIDGDAVNFDLYDPKLWQQQKWSIYDPEVQAKIIKEAETTEQGHTELETLKAFFNQQLKRAEAFWHALAPDYEVEHEGFVIMGGSCKQTLNRLIIEKDNNKIRFHESIRRQLGDAKTQKNILFEPGDGQVSKSSLLGQIHDPITHQTTETIKIKYPVFVCEDHKKLTSNITFQDNLLHILLND